MEPLVTNALTFISLHFVFFFLSEGLLKFRISKNCVLDLKDLNMYIRLICNKVLIINNGVLKKSNKNSLQLVLFGMQLVCQISINAVFTESIVTSLLRLVGNINITCTMTSRFATSTMLSLNEDAWLRYFSRYIPVPK